MWITQQAGNLVLPYQMLQGDKETNKNSENIYARTLMNMLFYNAVMEISLITTLR